MAFLTWLVLPWKCWLTTACINVFFIWNFKHAVSFATFTPFNFNFENSRLKSRIFVLAWCAVVLMSTASIDLHLFVVLTIICTPPLCYYVRVERNSIFIWNKIIIHFYEKRNFEKCNFWIFGIPIWIRFKKMFLWIACCIDLKRNDKLTNADPKTIDDCLLNDVLLFKQ